MQSPHYSVLLNEILHYFKDLHLNTFVDGTLGAGGHSSAILKNHPEIKTLVGFDQDPLALDIASKRLENFQSKVLFIKSNFVEMKRKLKDNHIDKVDGILLDLGVSSMQLDLAEKGFSFSKEGPLDMRMDPTNPLTAEEIVNCFDERDLARIFRDYGEEKQWRHAAKVIVRERSKKTIKTTKELAEILIPALKFKAKKGINPATLVFQALRIAVNDELGVLEKILPEALSLLAPKGRLAIITFHSLEDRLVKNYFRYSADDKFSTSGIGGVFLDKKPEGVLVTRKPVIPTEGEVLENARSRSAKLRVIEKV